MFTKKPDVGSPQPVAPAVAPVLAPRPAPPVGNAIAMAPQRVMAAVPAQMAGKSPASTIGPDLTIMGNLISKGEVVVDGEVQGDIACAHLTVGQTARITGGIVAEEVVVRGHVMGSIRGNRVNLQASSKVEGDIFHQSLAIEQGAMFEGRSRRANPDEQVNSSATRMPGPPTN